MLRFNHSFPKNLHSYFHWPPIDRDINGIMGSRDDMRSTIPTKTAEAGPKKDEEAVFQGWMATDATSPLKHTSFTPKKWEEEDIDIAVTHCGICASDLHVLSSGWVRLFLGFFPITTTPRTSTLLTSTTTIGLNDLPLLRGPRNHRHRHPHRFPRSPRHQNRRSRRRRPSGIHLPANGLRMVHEPPRELLPTTSRHIW